MNECDSNGKDDNLCVGILICNQLVAFECQKHHRIELVVTVLYEMLCSTSNINNVLSGNCFIYAGPHSGHAHINIDRSSNNVEQDQ